MPKSSPWLRHLPSIDPQTISYVEAHGTATPLGDPIEIAGLTQAFRAGGAIRHAGTARSDRSRATSAISTQLPASPASSRLHLRCTTRRFPRAFTSRRRTRSSSSRTRRSKSSVRCARGSPPKGSPRRAGVSSFGVGGTNAHVVLEEAPVVTAEPAHDSDELILLSARSASALDAATSRLRDHLLKHPADAARRRGVHAPHRPTTVPASTGAGRAGNGRRNRPARRLSIASDAHGIEQPRRRNRCVSVPWAGRPVGAHGTGALRGRSRCSVPMSTSARRSCGRSSASSCATCSTRSRATKSSQSSGSRRPRSPSLRCSSSSTRWRRLGAASGSSPTA